MENKTDFNFKSLTKLFTMDFIHNDGDYVEKGQVVAKHKIISSYSYLLPYTEILANDSGYIYYTKERLFLSKVDKEGVILFSIYKSKQDTDVINNQPNIEIGKPNIIENDKCYLYLMKDTSNNYYKVGISKSPIYRERTLQSEKPTIELIISKEYDYRITAKTIEKAIHNTFSSNRLRGEWFNFNDEELKIVKGFYK